MKLFKDEYGIFVEVHSSQDGMVEFASQGGGFLRSMSQCDFDKFFKPSARPGFSKIDVTADWLEVVLEAYSNGQLWNGWAVPYFALEAGKEIIQHLPGLRYDEAADAFVCKMEGHPPGEDEERYESTTIEVDGSPVKVYPIGAGS